MSELWKVEVELGHRPVCVRFPEGVQGVIAVWVELHERVGDMWITPDDVRVMPGGGGLSVTHRGPEGTKHIGRMGQVIDSHLAFDGLRGVGGRTFRLTVWLNTDLYAPPYPEEPDEGFV